MPEFGSTVGAWNADLHGIPGVMHDAIRFRKYLRCIRNKGREMDLLNEAGRD